MSNITITIDGAAIEAFKGESVLSAAQRAGVFIPHLCYDDAAGLSTSACRLCFIAVAGADGPVCACETVVHEGMEISTDDDQARSLSKAALSMALAEHAVSCGTCAKKGGCLIIKSAKTLGVSLRAKDQLEADPDRLDRIESLPVGAVAVNHDKCILCGRCIEACKTAGKSYIGLTGRGLNSLIAIDAQADEETCSSCARCIEACPAGALLLGTLLEGRLITP